MHHNAKGLTDSEKPVPESIIDGENILSVKVVPLNGEESLFVDMKSVDVKLVVREKDAPLNQYQTLVHIKMSSFDQKDQLFKGSDSDSGIGPVQLIDYSDKQIIAARKVNIDSPFPRWAWQDGAMIENNDENLISLVDEYKKIYVALKNENTTEIRELYKEAAREYAAAYHYKDVAQGHRIMNTGSLVGNQEWVLGDVQKLLDKGVKFDLDVSADGKLARLIDDRGIEGFLVYLNRKERMVAYQKFWFYKNKENEWVMIR